MFPIAALIARSDLDVAGDTALGHYTHEKSSVGCAAALATLEVIDDERLPEHAASLGAHALALLRELQSRHKIVSDVRGIGLLLAVELRDPDPARRRRRRPSGPCTNAWRADSASRWGRAMC